MKNPVLTDVNSDQQNQGLQSMLAYDRDTAARFGITSQLLDNTLYDAFGQRPVSVMYTALNQYQVIMEAAPPYWQSPEGLKDIYVRSSNGGEVPLSALAHYSTTVAPLTINHQGQFPCVTLSFNMALGKSLSDAVTAINAAQQKIGMPGDILGSFQGTAAVYKSSLSTELLIAPRRDPGYLYRARHSLRELHSSHHDPHHASLRHGRRGHRPARHRDGNEPDRRRGHPAPDRHREEKRDHDDRLRPQRRAARGQRRPPTPSSRPARSVPPHSHDHARRHVRRRAPGLRLCHRRRVAPAARRHHYRRPHHEPDADPLHHAGRLSLLGPPGPLAPKPPRPPRHHRPPRRPSRNPNLSSHELASSFSRLHQPDRSLPCPHRLRSRPPDYTPPLRPPSPSTTRTPATGSRPTRRTTSSAAAGGKSTTTPNSTASRKRVNIDNQNVLEAEATFRQAAAAVKVARAEFLPTVTTDPSVTYSQTQPLGKNKSGTGGGGVAVNSGGAGGTSVVGGGSGRDISPQGVYNLPLQVTYLADVWGQVAPPGREQRRDRAGQLRRPRERAPLLPGHARAGLFQPPRTRLPGETARHHGRVLQEIRHPHPEPLQQWRRLPRRCRAGADAARPDQRAAH